MHYLIKKAFNELFPDKIIDFEAKIKYSKAFKGFNANVKYSKLNKEFRLSYDWKEVSDEIKIGLIQNLLNKMYKTSITTVNIELYEIFLKKLTKLAPKLKSDPLLEDSFNRMNEIYFEGMLMQPNLIFGGQNFHTLGTYNYGDDTIMISSALTKDFNLLDYVMYHEMLHKKLQYKKTGKRTVHHSKEFRDLEKKYHDKDIERKLKTFIKREKFKKSWFMC